MQFPCYSITHAADRMTIRPFCVGSGLSLLNRLFYLDTMVYWLTYPFTLLILIAPIIFWSTGLPALECDAWAAFVLLVPYAMTRAMIAYWLSGRKTPPIVTIVAKTVPVFQVSLAIVSTFIYPFGRPFQVTAKGLPRSGPKICWPIFLPFVFLIGKLLLALLSNLAGYRGAVIINEFTAFDIVWALYSLVILTLSALACVDLPQRPSEGAEVDHCDLGASFRALVARLFG